MTKATSGPGGNQQQQQQQQGPLAPPGSNNNSSASAFASTQGQNQFGAMPQQQQQYNKMNQQQQYGGRPGPVGGGIGLGNNGRGGGIGSGWTGYGGNMGNGNLIEDPMAAFQGLAANLGSGMLDPTVLLTNMERFQAIHDPQSE
jgi:hypothetical protein